MMVIINEIITWYILALMLEDVMCINGAPCPYEGTHTPCVCAHKNGYKNGSCWSWARKPYFARPTSKTVGLGELKIKGIYLTQKREPNFLQQGYCRLAQPGPVHTVPLGKVAGSNITTKVDQIYAHPRYGLVGVNTTTHAKARFGPEGTYQNDYRQYVPECHCFVKIKEATSNGWIRILDDWTLWMGITHRARFSVPPKYFWQYNFPKERDVYGWPLLRLKTPRPPEKLLFQRHLDYRVVTLVNLTKNYPKGFKDFFWENYHYLFHLSSRRATDPNLHPQNRWLKTGQTHGEGATPPDYVNYILNAVMFYLADHASVTVTCSMEILNKQVKLGFGQKANEQNTLSIPYSLSGYAQSWKTLGPILMNKPNNGGRFACTFVPGVERPDSVGPSFVWMSSLRTPPTRQALPLHLSKPRQGLVVLHSKGDGKQGKNIKRVNRIQEIQFHPLVGYPAMWGDKCQKKRQEAKCHKRMVDLETKVRYAESFYDPYNNKSELPDHNQSVVFFPSRSQVTRVKRQFFAAAAIVTAFAVQGAVDYAGYEGIQGVEQELNDDMNTRAVANNERFRQADNAIGNLSRQIQDLNSKIEKLSESEEATVQLLLQTIKTQAVEDAVLQEQISNNQRTLVVLAKAHLREATANRAESDAQIFLLKTIVKGLTTADRDFLTSGLAYSWQLNNGIMRLQALEQQLKPLYKMDKDMINQQLYNLTCKEILSESDGNIKRLRQIEKSVKNQLQRDHNLTGWLNASSPRVIRIRYVPEYANRTVLQSGEKMRKAFEEVMRKPIPALEKVGKGVLTEVENVVESPLKKILGYGAAVIALVVVMYLVKRLVTMKSPPKRSITKRTLKTTQNDLSRL